MRPIISDELILTRFDKLFGEPPSGNSLTTTSNALRRISPRSTIVLAAIVFIAAVLAFWFLGPGGGRLHLPGGWVTIGHVGRGDADHGDHPGEPSHDAHADHDDDDAHHHH